MRKILENFLLKNLISNELIICMGAGSILKMDQRDENIKCIKIILNNENLSKYNWFNLGGPVKFFLNLNLYLILENF